MAAKDDMTIPLLPMRHYHIYNRGINKAAIFYNQENFRYFLSKYGQKMNGYFDTFAYCLLYNHFHLFVRVLDKEQLLAKAVDDFNIINQSFCKDYVLPWLHRMKIDVDPKGSLTTGDLTNFRNLLNLWDRYGDTQQDTSEQPADLKTCSFIDQLCSWVVSERFRGFMLGYAKAINKQESRTGSLLQKGFRRKHVPNIELDKKQVLFYIHHNPIHHYYTDNYMDYTWSSYGAYLTDIQTRICRNEGIEWFGNKNNFIQFGAQYLKNKVSDNQYAIDED